MSGVVMSFNYPFTGVIPVAYPLSVNFKPVFISLCFLSVSYSAYAAVADIGIPVDETDVPELVITASRVLQPINEVPASVTVIDHDVLKQSTSIDFPSLLRQQAALPVVSSGGYGQLSSIFMRGTNSNHTLVLHNGVRLNTATSSAANIQFLDLTDTDKVEILQGPASVQYGSDAIGGVVQLLSKTPTKQALSATLEAGEQGLYKAAAHADFVHDSAYLSLHGQRLGTDGSLSATNAPVSSGYEQKGYAVNAGIIQKDYQLSLEVKNNQGTSEYVDTDYLPDYSSIEVAKSQAFKQSLINLHASGALTDTVNMSLRLSQYNDHLQQLNSADFNNTTHNEGDMSLQWNANRHHHVLFGLASKNSQADVLSFGSAYAGLTQTQAVYLQHQYQDATWSTQIGMRSTHDADYGHNSVGQLAVRATLIPSSSKYSNSIYTNMGTAFHSPDANQKYSMSGNKLLKPEQSRSVELGLDQLLGDDITSHIDVFATKIDDLIVYTSKYPYTLANVNKADILGGHFNIGMKTDSGCFSRLYYNYTHAQDAVKHVDLPRRAKQVYGVSMGINQPKFAVSVDVYGQSSASETVYDSITYAAKPASIPRHLSADVHGSYQISNHIRIYANVLNVADTQYATAYKTDVATYLNAPRQAILGVRLTY